MSEIKRGYKFVPGLPEHYRLLRFDRVKLGDAYLWHDGKPYYANAGNTVAIGLVLPIIEPIPAPVHVPKWRPFKDAAEFKGDRNRWFYWLHVPAELVRVTSFGSNGVSGFSWESLFKGAKFEGGDTFGVLE